MADADPSANPFRRFMAALGPTDLPPRDRDDPEVDWEVDPPDLDTFVTSPAYLGLPPLSSRQLRALTEGLERDGRELFSPHCRYHELVLVWGKGSGKDLLASIIIAYVAYVVLCLRNPQRYFGLAPRESIDIVNVATRAEQARDVFFEKLKSHLDRPCFQRYQPRVVSQKVEFLDKRVRLHSLHSKAQKWEGYNLLAWVMDEADAFQTAEGHANADEVYGVLRSSAVSRFPDRRWIGLILSYPRSETGFVLEHARRAQADGTAYVDIAPTWEVHPFYDPTHPLYRGFAFVEVNGYRVPEPFAPDFRSNPSLAAMTYLCQPPPMAGAFFEEPSFLERCADPNLPPAVWAVPRTTVRQAQPDDEQRVYVAWELVRQVTPAGPYMYYLHGDPGERRDAFALCLAHTLPETVTVTSVEQEVTLNRVVVDVLLEWVPRPGVPVDMLNVRDVIVQLCAWYPVVQVTFDQFQSAQVVQELLELGINAKQLSFSRKQQLQMYRALKLLVYNDLIRWPSDAWDALRPQLRYLIQRGDSITHDERVSRKDLADAVAAAAWFASGAAWGRAGRLVQETIHGLSSGTSPQVGLVKRRLTA
jgi:hypothetical protein